MSNIFRYIYNSIFINNSDENKFFKELLTISIITIVYYVYKKYVDDDDELYSMEGFTQTESYIFKKNDDCYDDFYINIYNLLYNNYKHFPLELEHIIKTTMPTNNSVILDLCSRTGLFVNELNKYNYNAHGLENSKNMIEYSEKNYPGNNIVNGSITNPMLFNNNSFSHIVCNNFNIYRFKNKGLIFRHCYYWLRPNGYFIIHLINPDKFDTLMPIAKPTLYNNIQNKVKTRIKKCNVKFLGFDYNCGHEFEDNNIMKIKEKFIDNKSNNIRQQERELYLNSLEEIEKLAQLNGFHLHSKAKMTRINGDKNQYIYIFEKIH